jgi:hypothetical protein
MDSITEFYKDLASLKEDMLKGSKNDKTMNLRDFLLKLIVTI